MKNWLMFVTLGAIWGSSFLLIKIGVSQFDPLSMVSLRIGTASIAYIAAMIVMRKPIPRDPRILFNLFILGIIYVAVPFALITWGESQIDSGLASVLNSTVPLWSLVIAHFALSDDKMYFGKIIGLLGGFCGIVMLATRSVDPTHPNPITGQIAVLVAALCYAISAVHSRRNLQNVDPVVNAGVSIVFATVIIIVLTVATVHPLPNPANILPGTYLAVIFLGLANTFIANILFFTLIKNWGASRTTMVTYTAPPTGVVLGAIFNHEPLDWKLLAGAALIITGVVVVNLLRPRPPVPADIVTAPDSAIPGTNPTGK